MESGLLARLIGIRRNSFELIERGQEWFEGRLADEDVLVEVVLFVRHTPLYARVSVVVRQHGLPSHSSVHKA